MSIKIMHIVNCALIAALIAILCNSSKEDESIFSLVQTTVHIRKPALPIVTSNDTIDWTAVDQQRQVSDSSSSDDSNDSEKFNVREHESTRASQGSILLRLISRLLEMRDKKNKVKAKKVKDKNKSKVRNFQRHFTVHHWVLLTEVSPEMAFQKANKERTEGSCKCAYCD
jgi:hypothetical protein